MDDRGPLAAQVQALVRSLYGTERRAVAVLIQLDDGHLIPLPVAPGHAPATAADEPPFRHSPDYRCCTHQGNEYNFSRAQAAVIEMLHCESRRGTPSVAGQTLLEQAESTSNRVADLFKDHPAWNTLVIVGGSKGTYRLNL